MSPARSASTWRESCGVAASDGARGAAHKEQELSSAIGMQRWQDWHPQPAREPSCSEACPSATLAIIGQSPSIAADTVFSPLDTEDWLAAPTI